MDVAIWPLRSRVVIGGAVRRWLEAAVGQVQLLGQSVTDHGPHLVHVGAGRHDRRHVLQPRRTAGVDQDLPPAGGPEIGELADDEPERQQQHRGDHVLAVVDACLGAPLARLEGAALFRTLAEHVRSIDILAGAVRTDSAAIRGYATLPVELG